jgi:PPOX class probable F420-dependent enzyme
MPEKMTIEQRRAFLTTGTRTATIASLRADGRPHAVPVWYVLDGDDIVCTVNDSTVKARNIARDPRVTVVVDDEAAPYAFVSIEGRAELSQDGDELRRIAGEVGRRYLDDEQAIAGYVEYMTGPGVVVVRVRPTHIVAVDKVAG